MKKQEFGMLFILISAAVLVLTANAVFADKPQRSISGPTAPPVVKAIYDAQEQARKDREAKGIPEPVTAQTTIVVPDYLWRHGCGPTTLGMVIGYYDVQGYALIPGDASTQTAAVNQAIASEGDPNVANYKHYEDYAQPKDYSPIPLTDDYITKGRIAHTSDSVGDFMRTSQSNHPSGHNYYGWSWNIDMGPAFVNYVNSQNASYSPGYSTYLWSTGAMAWAVLTNEIDNGRPMVFLVDSDGDGSTDHFVPIVGYDPGPPQKYGCHDTWTQGIKWWTFQGMANGQQFGIYEGWTFSLSPLGETTKWEQPPDATYYGMDVRCDRRDGIQRVLADDFQCTTTGKITKVTLWGSWKNDTKGQIAKIHLSIHDDKPMPPTGGYSEPNTLLWSKDFTAAEFNEILFKDLTPEYEWWWQIGTTPIQAGDHKIWQYDIAIDPNIAFVQEGDPCNPIVYWLDVYAILDTNIPGQFGWKTSVEHWNDDAVWSIDDGIVWNEMRYPPPHPYQGDSVDLAFAIITSEEQEEEPNYIKWSQPPVPYTPEPPPATEKWTQMPDLTTDGIDVSATEPFILADDFLCTTTGRVTKISIFGSWKYDELPDGDANNIQFTLSIHSDKPAPPYSEPNTLLWSQVFPAGQFKVTRYATNITEGWMDPPSSYFFPADWTCWRYDFDIPYCQAFMQEGNTVNPVVYWLDVQAQPLGTQSSYFGWKTSLTHWNDDAVWGQGSEPYTGTWSELRYPIGHPLVGQSIDLAFEIYTTEDVIAPEDTYWGWDERADNILPKMVADDFRCDSNKPVTAIRWWGSFLNWYDTNVPTAAKLPSAFYLTIWTDVPAGQDAPTAIRVIKSGKIIATLMM